MPLIRLKAKTGHSRSEYLPYENLVKPTGADDNVKRLYTLCKFLQRDYLMCFGGSSAPSAPPPPQPPPQLATSPDVAAVKASTSANNIAGGGVTPSTTLLTGGQGQAIDPATLGKKTLLGA